MKKHPICTEPDGLHLPSRVIDVSRMDEESLAIFCPTAKIDYAALTHCWGGGKPFSTSSANLALRSVAFDLAELPRTFQDAVKVTRRLGLRYLWIDSICIVQDSRDDWAKESMKMGDIYAGSSVTIAATQAPNSETGFLRDREPSVRIQVADRKNRQLTFGLLPPIPHNYNTWDSYPPQASGARMTTRAWCFQERILSPRVLHFTKAEVVLVCRSQNKCECHQDNLSEYDNNDLAYSMSPMARELPLHTDFSNFWMSIVMDYTRGQLTVEMDRLPALAGVARRMEKYSPGRYLAGMWEQGLARQLPWFCSSDYGNACRLPEYAAPTWSWASAKGDVLPFSIHDSYPFGRFKPVCTVVECRCVGVDGSPGSYGQVQSGFLRVKSRMFSLDDHLQYLDATKSPLIQILDTRVDSQVPCVTCYRLRRGPHVAYDGEPYPFCLMLDSPLSDLTDMTGVFLLAVLEGSSPWSLGIAALVLRPTNIADTFTRIGMAKNCPKVWFQEPDRTITVI